VVRPRVVGHIELGPEVAVVQDGALEQERLVQVTLAHQDIIS
jgi:hypothetical protein